jgi:hypothetical protein
MKTPLKTTAIFLLICSGCTQKAVNDLVSPEERKIADVLISSALENNFTQLDSYLAPPLTTGGISTIANMLTSKPESITVNTVGISYQDGREQKTIEYKLTFSGEKDPRYLLNILSEKENEMPKLVGLRLGYQHQALQSNDIIQRIFTAIFWIGSLLSLVSVIFCIWIKPKRWGIWAFVCFVGLMTYQFEIGGQLYKMSLPFFPVIFLINFHKEIRSKISRKLDKPIN